MQLSHGDWVEVLGILTTELLRVNCLARKNDSFSLCSIIKERAVLGDIKESFPGAVPLTKPIIAKLPQVELNNERLPTRQQPTTWPCNEGGLNCNEMKCTML